LLGFENAFKNQLPNLFKNLARDTLGLNGSYVHNNAPKKYDFF
jgi:hypothetical protein